MILLRKNTDISTFRIPELDAIRGIGAIIILALHLWPRTFFFGWSRVDLFFVISGYLITNICIKYRESEKFLIIFYTRRILRTWPAYYLLVGMLCVGNLASGRENRVDAVLYHLTFTQNLPLWWGATCPELSKALEHCWCLAIEEQFYLIWPAFTLFLTRRGVLTWAILIVIGSVSLRSCGFHPWLLMARADGLGLGAILSALISITSERTNTFKRKLSKLFLVCILITFPFIAYINNINTSFGVFATPLPPLGSLILFAANLFYFGVVGLVVTSSGRPALKPLRIKKLYSLGQITYGIFLFHYPIIYIYLNIYNIKERKFLLDLDVALICVFSGFLSWSIIEKPIINIREKYFCFTKRV